MALFAFFVSSTFATLMGEAPAEQVRLGARFMGGFLLGGLALVWLLYFLPL